MHLEQALIEAATTQGIWVPLFVLLFLYTIKNNEKLVEKQDKREENYQKLLSDMTEKYAVVEDIRNSVDEIQKKMEQISIEQKEQENIVLYEEKSLIANKFGDK